jgi:phosphate transport system protein
MTLTYLEQELDNIKLKIFEMSDMAIEAIVKSVESLKNADIALAEKVIENDNHLDKMEIQIDDECIKVLVTRQPAAVDLRFVLAVLKINTDLERIGDLATNVAKETLKFNGKPHIKPLIDIPRMASIAIEMIQRSFQAITEKDDKLAREVIEMDDEIDKLNLQVYRELFSYMAEDAKIISQSLGLIMVAKALERIGDHATNIAERAIYYAEGIDVRHSDE